MTALPHKRNEDREWVRDGADIRLRIESGKTHDGTSVGVPFGYVARLILLYLQTEAIKTQSREVELGRSMHSWLKAMGLNSGGKGYEAVREQSRRLSLCRLTFYRIGEGGEAVMNGGFVREAILPSRDADGAQLSLWRETVVLDEVFFESLPPSATRPRSGHQGAGRPQHGDRSLHLARIPALQPGRSEARFQCTWL